MKRPVISCVLVLLLGSGAVCEDELEVHFVDVGQGDCILLRCPDGRRVLVDCGSKGGGNKGKVKDYVETQLDAQHPRLDVVVITHPDDDHCNWIPDVLDKVTVGRVLTSRPSNEFKCADWLDGQSDVKDLEPDDYDKEGQPSKLFGSGGTKFYVLAADAVPTKNGQSIVLLVTYKDFDVVLMGDATAKVEKTILGRSSHQWLACEVLKVGHHGAETSTSEGWLENVKPEVAVLSCAYGNKFGHPRKTIVERLADRTVDESPHSMRWATSKTEFTNVPDYREAIYSTATNGTVVVRSNGKSFSVEYKASVKHTFSNN